MENIKPKINANKQCSDVAAPAGVYKLKQRKNGMETLSNTTNKSSSSNENSITRSYSWSTLAAVNI